MNKALELAAQCWCLKETEHLIMIPELAEAFAYTLDPILGELDEIRQENQRLREALLECAKIAERERPCQAGEKFRAIAQNKE